MLSITLKTDTRFKRRPVNSSQLTPNDFWAGEEGQAVSINWWRPAEANHIQVELATPVRGVFNWFAFEPHITLLDEGLHPLHQETPDRPTRDTNLIRLPSGDRIGLDMPIIPGGSFTWAEATKGGTRMPDSRSIEGNIIKTAQTMQEIRNLLGVPITVTSWNRPPAVNAAVGGARNSRHTLGDAVDWFAHGLTTQQAFNRVRPWWGNRGGIAMSARGQFIHIDLRGYLAVWNY